VLVALGMGYYPRWRAHHASGAEEPVYAMPSIPNGKLHVVAAWVAPGHTIFTCDGKLPSDGKGRIWTLLAGLFAVASTLVWTRPRWRTRVLRRAARLRVEALARLPKVIEMFVAAVVVASITLGIIAHGRSQSAVLVGSSGIRPLATVEARFVGESAWNECGYQPMDGQYRCEGLVAVNDATINILNDVLPSWAYITPSIAAYAETALVEVRITRTLHLGGRYWLGSSAGKVTMMIDNSFATEFVSKTEIDIPRGEHTVQMTARVPDNGVLHIVFVAQDSLEPDRDFLVAPPREPPPSVSAIAR
jgi:hypothetical protein